MDLIRIPHTVNSFEYRICLIGNLVEVHFREESVKELLDIFNELEAEQDHILKSEMCRGIKNTLLDIERRISRK